VVGAERQEMARGVERLLTPLEGISKRLTWTINFPQSFHSISRKGKESFDVHDGI
jgi:hypothetical protein